MVRPDMTIPQCLTVILGGPAATLYGLVKLAARVVALATGRA